MEDAVVDWVSRGDMGRQVAAHGMNLCYLLCKALDLRMPTMRVAMTVHARVSPFTTERIGQAVVADRYRSNCLHALRSPLVRPDKLDRQQGLQAPEEADRLCEQERAKLKFALGSFQNVATSSERWLSSVHATLASSVPRRHVFDAAFEYEVKGHDGRVRECRGLLDVLCTHARPFPTLTIEGLVRMRDLYRELRPESAKVAADLSQWIRCIRWFAHMYLPPLVAAHVEGSLNDQSVQGPLARVLGWSNAIAPVKARNGKHVAEEVDAHVQNVMPQLSLIGENSGDPHGWVPGFFDANSSADVWLRWSLCEDLGGPNDTTTREDLSDALMEAYDTAPAEFRRRVGSLVARLLAHHGLDPYDRIQTRADHVDRHVLDFASYDRLLDALALSCLTSRMSERQARMRLLIVLAFRFGFRRREILFLRRGDVDLLGEGRIHIRPYDGHTLKTGFSRRSLPIVPLLNEQERHWLIQATQASELRNPADAQAALLIPKCEHDTLTRGAIALLRRIGCDDRLKLHHLRHSFASWMALRIMFARRPAWAEVFAGHPEIHREMLGSPALIGTVLKPELSAGDFLSIPRMLGHSSYEVSLTNYVHTMDLVSALFVGHELSHVIVPQRDLVHLVNRRYQEAVNLRKASLAGHARVAPAENSGPTGDASAKPWSAKLNDAVLT